MKTTGIWVIVLLAVSRSALSSDVKVSMTSSPSFDEAPAKLQAFSGRATVAEQPPTCSAGASCSAEEDDEISLLQARFLAGEDEKSNDGVEDISNSDTEGFAGLAGTTLDSYAAQQSVSTAARADASRIWNGQEESAFEDPWVVMIDNPDKRGDNRLPYCTGSFIGIKWVLTAKHCFQGEPIKKWVTVSEEHKTQKQVTTIPQLSTAEIRASMKVRKFTCNCENVGCFQKFKQKMLELKKKALGEDKGAYIHDPDGMPYKIKEVTYPGGDIAVVELDDDVAKSWEIVRLATSEENEGLTEAVLATNDGKPTGVTTAGSTLTAMGFGSWDPDGVKTNDDTRGSIKFGDQLKSATLQPVSGDYCFGTHDLRRIHEKKGLTENSDIICTVPMGGFHRGNVRNGDSGGPLVKKDGEDIIQFGSTIQGSRDSSSDPLSSFMNLAKYREAICTACGTCGACRPAEEN